MNQNASPQNPTMLPEPNHTPPEGAQAANCPSCGRFVGPYTTCPYCGAAISGRISLKLVKALALSLAIIGLFVLWQLASRTEIPLLSIAEIGSMMNMAFVRVEGRITRAISYDPASDYLGFWIDDGTGELYVSIYRETTQSLLEAGKIPAVGDIVSLAGSLRIREDYTAMTLNNLDHLTLNRPPPVALKSSDLTSLDEGRRIVLMGELTSVSTPYAGLTLLTLKDDAGEIAVAIDKVTETLTGSVPEVDVSDHVVVTGTVTLYKGTPQVTLVDSRELAVQPIPDSPEPVVRALSLISLNDLRSQVLVQGRVVSMEGINGGLKGILDDGTAQIICVFWSRVYDALDTPTDLDLGATITIYGEVSAYQGELEIIPRTAADITIQSPAPDIAWVSIEALSRADRGRVVRIRGLLGYPEGFSSGVKIPLRDGSGRITVLLWSNIYDALKPKPVEDMLVEVTGIIDYYNGALEIIPRSTYDVVNMDQGD